MPRKPSKKESEEWRSIPGFSIYEASTKGRIRSIDRNISQRVKGGVVANINRKGRILKQKTYTGGYKSVMIKRDSDQRFLDMPIHRLVVMTYIPNTEKKKCVHHINHKRDDNRLNNLMWSTHSENNKEAYKSGNQSRRGEKNSVNKLLNSQVLIIKKKLENGESYKELASDYKVSNQCIRDIKIGRRWGWLKL